MEWHQELQRGRESPLFTLNNTKPMPYYVLELSEVVITAPDHFSCIVVCIKLIFSALIKGLTFIPTHLQLLYRLFTGTSPSSFY